MPFDYHDPEVEALMQQRAVAQAQLPGVRASRIVFDFPPEELAAWAIERWNELVAAMKPLIEGVAEAFQNAKRVWSATGLLPPDPESARRGDRWSGPAGRYRLVVTRQRGPHWKPVGPTRERWWK